MNRLMVFLYGRKNLGGCVLGLIGLGLFLLGFIDKYWLAIVVGMYLIGWIVTPAERQLQLILTREANASGVKEQLDELMKKIKPQVDDEVFERVSRIHATIVDMLPALFAENLPDRNLYDIRQTALEYLPATLEHYLALPNMYRRKHVVRDGKTARDLLIEQLTLLDNTMTEALESINRSDAEALLSHGRFLQDKFRKDKFGV